MHNALHKLEALFRLLSPQHIVIAELQKTNESWTDVSNCALGFQPCSKRVYGVTSIS